MGIKETKELNEALAKQKALMEANAAFAKTQSAMMLSMRDAIRQMNIEGFARGVEQMNQAVKGAGEALDSLDEGQQTMQRVADATEEATKDMGDLGDGVQNFGKKMLKLAPVVAMFEGMAGGFKLSMNAMSSFISVGTGLISTLFNLSAAIIAIPFKILYGLMGQVGGGGSGLREAFEEVRETFGDLAHNEGKALIESWRKVDHFGGELAQTGLSVWRTMGNMAEQMRAVKAIADQMGPLFHNFHREIVNGGERMFAYQKGLHLTEEGMSAVTQMAARAGTTFQETAREITSVAFSMGKAFGQQGALISQDIGTMMDDFEHFGSLGVKELSQISVYARKLGVEIEKLTGTLDQFADFDKAAESIAMLSQAFGLQLDTLEMVNEQDPAANIDRLRKAFHAAGRSIETMTRQERALLASHTGLDEKTASLVFSQENQALSYADIQKQGESSEKQQLSQAEAMEALSGSIKRLIKSGGGMQGGFFDIFMKGFLRGIRRTKEFWTLMRHLRRSMRATFRAGRKVGQYFVKHFPGVRDVLKGIGELFDPRRFRKMLGGVVKAFRHFFLELTSNPDVALSSLLEKLKKTFFNWFDESTPHGMRVVKGFQTFIKTLGTIFGSLLKVALKGAVTAVKGIIEFIKDPSAAIGAAKSAGGGFATFLMEVLQPAWDAVVEQGPALLDALKELLSIVWEKVKPFIVTKAIPALIAIMFGPALIGGITRAVFMAVSVGVLRGVTQAIAGESIKAGGGLLKKGIQRMMKSSSSVAAAAPKGGPPPIGPMAKSAADASKATKGITITRAAELGAVLIILAGAIAIGGVNLAAALAIMKRTLAMGGINGIADAVLPLTILAASIGGAIIASKFANAMPAAQSALMAVNLSAGALALGLSGMLFATAIIGIKAILVAGGLKTAGDVAMPFLVLGAAILATLALVAVGLTLEPTTVSLAGVMLLVAAAMLTISGAGFVGAIAAIDYILTKAGLNSVEKVAFPLLTVVAAAGAFVLMTGAVMAMAAIANPVVIIAGFVGMIAVMGFAYLALKGLGGLSKVAADIGGESNIKNIAKSVSAAALIYGSAAVLGVAAAGFGAIVLSGGGLILMGVGMIALTSLAQMAREEVNDTIIAVNAIDPVDPRKLEIFTTILKALGSFAGSMASVLSASQPSFMAFAASWWGADPGSAEANLKQINTLVKTIGTEVRNIIDTIIAHTSNLSPEQLDQANKMSTIISAVAALVTALQPPESLTGGFLGSVFASDTIDSLGSYFSQMVTVLPQLFDTTATLMRQLNNMPAIDEAKIQGFSAFATGIGSLLGALAPSDGAGGLLGIAQGQQTLDDAGDRLISLLPGITVDSGTNRTADAINMIKNYAQVMIDVLTKGTPSFMETIMKFMKSMTEIGSGLDESQIKGVEAVTGIFTSIVSLVSNLAETFASEDFRKLLKSPLPPAGTLGTVFAGIVGGIISPLAQYIPGMIAQLKKATEGMRPAEITRLSSTVEMFSTIIGTVSTLTTILSGLSGEDGGDATEGGSQLTTRLAGIGEMLSALLGSGGSGGSIITALQSLMSVRIPPRAGRTIETIGKALKAVGTILDVMPTLGGIAMQPSRVAAMVAGINHLFVYGHGPAFLRAIQALGSLTVSSRAAPKAQMIADILEPVGDIASRIKSVGSRLIDPGTLGLVGVLFNQLFNPAGAGIVGAFIALGESGLKESAVTKITLFADVMEQVTRIASTMNNASETMTEDMVSQMATGVTAMADRMHDINRALTGITAFNIDTKMSELNTTLGLRSTGRLNISGDNVPITWNVTFDIKIDAEQLETVLLKRPGTKLGNNST